MNALIATLALLCGCAINGGRCYPVIGFGWIRISTNEPAVFTSRTIGLNTGKGQASLGLSSFTTIIIPTNSNVVIDLKK